MYVERESCLSSVGKEEEEEEEGWDYLTPLHNTRYRQEELSEGKRREIRCHSKSSKGFKFTLLSVESSSLEKNVSLLEGREERGHLFLFFAMFGFFCLGENDRRTV